MLCPHSSPTAAALLGEVRAGQAATMRFEGPGADGAAAGEGGQQKEAPEGVDQAMEAAMLGLLAERAKQYEAEQQARFVRCAVARCAVHAALISRIL